MSLTLAKAMSRLGTETAFEVLARANALAAQGKNVINLGIGQPDFKTPPHVVEAAVKALKDKRAALAGEIIRLKKKIDWAESQLRHVDATLSLFDPKIDAAAIPPSRPKKRVKLFKQGELNRLIFDALRVSGEPTRTFDVITSVILALGHEESARPALGPRVRSNLQYLMRRGEVAKIGSGRDARWKLNG